MMLTRLNRALIRVMALAALTTLVSGSGVSAGRPRRGTQGTEAVPKLVVILVVDQMRADYLERYASHFTGGLRRMTQEGAWFQRAAYPYLNTITCAGHSTIGTGALPYRHGMILNSWYDRDTGQAIDCTSDDNAQEVGYSGLTGGGDSGRWLRVPTLADRIRGTARGRVVTMSLKARSAIGLAGHKGDAVLWFDTRGGWATSSAFASKPVPFVQEFIKAHPVTADYGRSWDRLRDAATYENADDAEGERPPAGWTRTFPHVIGSKSGQPDAEFYARWMGSPLSDSYLGLMAAAAVDSLNLGKGPGTDFLGVSFSALDLIGHAFGPNSQEVQDVLARADVTIGALLEHLDAKVGAGNYVVGFSSDHGVGQIPEQSGIGGRQTSPQIVKAIDTALEPFFGPGKPSYVALSAYTDVYLAKNIAKRLKGNQAASAAVFAALRALPGIAQVFRGDELGTPEARLASDPVKRAAALSYLSGRSGDLILVPRENWILTTSATTHGTLYPYDQRVPVILFGAGVKKGVYQDQITPADLAPTLAKLARIAFEETDGHVLSPALASAAGSSR
jgi:predicted AlkP superfamily pyrophosphatase or phosphodiesterase